MHDTHSAEQPAFAQNAAPVGSGMVDPVPSGLPRLQERDTGTRVFLGLLFTVAVCYAVILLYHAATPVQTVKTNEGFLENCRQICLQYGLVSTGNLRRDAESYIRVVQPEQLSEPLAAILHSRGSASASQQHALLNQKAPDFTLPDDRLQSVSLQQLGQNRPLVVVFYLGYGCSHCVAQLVSLERDLHYFRELDADVVAISADSPQHTADRFKQYGRFAFSVLADEDHAVATDWSVFHSATEQSDELMDHGTFVVDRNGQVIWACTGKEPFLDNRSLLQVIAKSQGLLPESVAHAK